MSISVPLITDPNDHFLGTLPFVHTRARNEFLNSIRRAFDDTTGEQKSVRVMLHLSTRNGPTLMEMIANVVHNESELLVILMGRAIESSLAGLLHHADNDADGTESQISSMTVSSMAAPSIPACIPLLSLPCSIQSSPTFVTCRPPLSLSCVSSLTSPEWDENQSKISSLTMPSCLADGVGSESELKTSSITAPFKSTISSSTVSSVELEVPPEPLQSMLPNAHKCSVCLKNYRPSEEYTPPWLALTRQLCPKCNTMHFSRIAPPMPSTG